MLNQDDLIIGGRLAENASHARTVPWAIRDLSRIGQPLPVAEPLFQEKTHA